ncbi:hypothetical protein TNCV_72571 [Trichonephila clavipes]|uniref:Uncharacterized protein n=1 Tax=Trichonephila clavipes TaxID=2585209 RepID=A0A8X6V1C7_TRICX|nr:hypothetical protein TNCV_72571 [Trichonephila clavipes]
MSQDIIQNLYTSIPDCIATCIRARGGSIGYNFYGCIDPNEHKCSHFCRRVPNLPSDLPPNLMTLTPPKCSSFHFPLPNDNEERRNVAL